MKIYVGNLPWSVDDAKLKEMFSKFGNVEEATVLVDKFSKRSKGFGFVTLADADAKKAIAELNGKEIEGRALKVNEAKPFDPDAPREPRKGGFNRGGSGGGFRSGGFNKRRF